MVWMMENVEPPVTPTQDTTRMPTAQATASPKPSIKERFQTLLTEYGALALVVHYALFFLSMGVFAMLIRSGVRVEGAAGAASTWGGAYLASQVIKIPRLAATFVLTPPLARLIRRLRKKGPDST
jgi:hypothetical protein